MLETVAWGIFEGNKLALAGKNGSSVMKAEKIIHVVTGWRRKKRVICGLQECDAPK